MLRFLSRRIAAMIVLLVVISMVVFALIQLPPGDYLTSYAAALSDQGDYVSQDMLEALKQRYGIDRPLHVQYWRWVTGVLQGDFGYSFEFNRPVSRLIWGRVFLTLVVSTGSLVFSVFVAFSLGIVSALKQHTWVDYVTTFVGFIGLATPNFMLALVFMWIAFQYFGQNVGGLFSPEFVDAPWSFARVMDLLPNLWIPVVVIGTAGTASMMRIMRANLLDELNKPYVETARSKGLRERSVVIRHAVRMSLIPFISTLGWRLPTLFSGEAIVGIVLGLPTIGPLLLRSLMSQDMFLAGSLVLILSFLTVIGTVISDILLAWLDPRLRYE